METWELPSHDIEKIILAVVEGTPRIGQDDIEEFVEWCKEQLIGGAIVSNIIAGRLIVHFDPKGEHGFTTRDK